MWQSPDSAESYLGSRALGVPCTMAWPFVCLLLLTCCSGSFSQVVLTQSPSMSASLGATARLTCTLDSQHSGYRIEWFQQIPGKAPRYLMYVKGDGSAGKGEGVPDRFSGSASGADRYLSINNLQPEDEGDYYCGAACCSNFEHYVFGEGTRLTVTGLPKASPMVTAFAPSKPELETKKATLVCVINGFYPSTMDVAWTKNGSPVTQGVMTSPPVRQSDNKYTASSYLSLSADQWLSDSLYSCKVTHEGQVFQKELSSTQCI